MNILMIMLGIYVYFVVGNLVFRGLCKLDNTIEPAFDRGEKFFVVLIFPIFTVLVLFVLVYENFHKLPKFNIPFTPAKIADKILKINFKKLIKFRIRFVNEASESDKIVYDEQSGKVDDRFKVGDRVIVIGNSSSHGFKIGEICTITFIRDVNCYKLSNGKDYWGFKSSEFELYKGRK